MRARRRYFNPRPREGSDSICFKVCVLEDISIHAPAKGATTFKQSFTIDELFQSTPPRRERLQGLYIPVASALISIHAPAKGATHGVIHTLLRITNFNPRPREGSDLPGGEEITIIYLFQSTPPRRERQSSNKVTPHLFLFQSTPPRRERQPYYQGGFIK